MDRAAAGARSLGHVDDDAFLLRHSAPDSKAFASGECEFAAPLDHGALVADLFGAQYAPLSGLGAFAIGVKEQVSVDGSAARQFAPALTSL